MTGRRLVLFAGLGIAFLAANAQGAAIGTTVSVAGGKYTNVTAPELGYANVWNLQGGMAAWDRQGYPVIRRSSR